MRDRFTSSTWNDSFIQLRPLNDVRIKRPGLGNCAKKICPQPNWAPIRHWNIRRLLHVICNFTACDGESRDFDSSIILLYYVEDIRNLSINASVTILLLVRLYEWTSGKVFKLNPWIVIATPKPTLDICTRRSQSDNDYLPEMLVTNKLAFLVIELNKLSVINL
jgi:hypothetical protein